MPLDTRDIKRNRPPLNNAAIELDSDDVIELDNGQQVLVTEVAKIATQDHTKTFRDALNGTNTEE